MVDTDFQKDFFKEQLYEVKAKKPRLINRYSERRFLSHIRIPVEYAVIMAIGILTLLTVTYAVGVKKGEISANVGGTTTILYNEDIETNSIKESINREGEIKKLAEEKVEEAPLFEAEDFMKPVEEVTEEENSIARVEKMQYVIQLASFKNKDSAQEEIDALKRQGIRADLSKSGEWYQVYTAGYQTIDEAKKAKQELIKVYKDCYIKRVK